jgi:hypothetical protein
MSSDPYCINCLNLPICTRYPNKKVMLMYCDFHSSFLKLKGFAKQRHEARLLKESLVEDGINKGEI